MKSVCIYCGSADEVHVDYLAAARQVGEILARKGVRIVYGGGRTGLMGALAEGALAFGGEVFGVIIPSMNTEPLAHRGISRLYVTPTIHQRKARMYQLAEGYIALPGGFGTLDELFETLTWAQIGQHAKPVGLLNVKGYFDPLLAMLDRATEEKFIFPEHRRTLISHSDPEKLLSAMQKHKPPHQAVERWMRRA